MGDLHDERPWNRRTDELPTKNISRHELETDQLEQSVMVKAIAKRYFIRAHVPSNMNARRVAICP